jgi:hypothetical protein|uniref:BACON domain-containing protein n=1 Tax=Bacteroides fragilis TaxID=817 RepID=UPI0035660862
MKILNSFKWKVILVLGIVLPMFIACQQDENSEVLNQNPNLYVGADFLKLSNDSTGVAGHLTIQSNVPEVHLKWNTDSLCNLDTTQNIISLKNGRFSLPIKWHEKLGNGNYGPDGMAFKAGVKITAGEYSQYVPLIWADQVDSMKIRESLVRTRAVGDVMPSVETPGVFPTTLTLSEENGGTMMINLGGEPFAILDFSEFTSDLNLDLSQFPTSITQNTVLNFKWKAGGAPAFGFEARVVVMVPGVSFHGVVQYLKSTPQVEISASPTLLAIGGGQGAKASSVITTNDTQGWIASVTEGNWFTVTPSGTNGARLEVTSLSPNTTGVTRTGTITVTAKSNPSSKVTITVTQTPMTNITLSANPASLKLGTSSGSSASSIITTNDPLGWTAVSSASWLSVTASGFNGSSLTVASNSTGSSRTATVTVTSVTDPSKNIIISVTQAGVYNLKVMTVGYQTIGTSSIQLGAYKGTPLYTTGLQALLTSNFGPYTAAPYTFTHYNYYNGGYLGSNNSKDYTNVGTLLRQYDIDIACLFDDYNASPTAAQARDILAWLDENPKRALIMSISFATSNIEITNALGLYDRKYSGEGYALNVATASYNNPTFQSIMLNGTFGNVYNGNFRTVDAAYLTFTVQDCQNAGFVPLLVTSKGRVMIAIHPTKRIFFTGETQFYANGVVNTNGSLSPTGYGPYPQLMANLWAWICNTITSN